MGAYIQRLNLRRILVLFSSKIYRARRAGSRGPRAPRHTIWPGPPILATYKQQLNPFTITNSFAGLPRSHLIQDRIYNTGSHLIQDRALGAQMSCGGAYLAWCPSICASFAALSSCAAGRRTLRSSVHGDLVFPFARFAAMQNRSCPMVGWSNNLQGVSQIRGT